MRTFNRDSGNKRDFKRFSKRDSFNRRDSDRSEKQMHEVICDKCGQSCEVPFKPTSGKPVYCRACFGKEESPRQESRSDYKSPNREFRPKHESSGSGQDNLASEIRQINAKLDQILEILNEE